jgi:Glycosyl hydrolase family 92 N-terminal domain/Glycosyl hydrolase family 92/F5/8 type C domain
MTYARVGTLSGIAWAVLIWCVTAAPAAAAERDFSSSFEAGDPQPTWTDSAERSGGVVHPKPPGIPGNVTDLVAAVRASGENPPGERKENLLDGAPSTKWLVFARSAWIEYELSEPRTVVRYGLTSANDEPSRDPRDWTLSGSNDGQTWTQLDERRGEEFADRFQDRRYEIENTTAYRHYRLEISANAGAGIIQLADFLIGDASPPPPRPDGMTSAVGAGPVAPYNAKSKVGFTGLAAFSYAGDHTADGRGHSTNRVFDVDLRVGPRTELSYVIFPRFVTDDLSYPSTYAAVDLAFTDGTYLSDLGARDQHGAVLSPRGQGESKTLFADQWNFKRARIGAVAADKTIDRILVAYDNPDGPADFGGWVDDIVIDGDPPSRQRSHPSDWVVTTRGTYSSSGFSRGNTIPATAVPHGFNFWIPVSHSGTPWFLYEYHRDNNAQNLPELESLSLSHEASPFMGDRQTFQVLPSAASGAPPTGRAQRALAYRHESVTAKPYRYGVEFENGIKAEIAPTDHAAMFRFRFPDEHANLVFENVDRNASVTIDQAGGVLTGYSDVRSGLSNGATRMFIYATFDRPIADSATSAAQTGYAKFDVSAGRTVTMRIATSLISLDQARKNLALEIAPSDTFERLAERARDRWDDSLDVIEVEGATEDQLTTLYSNLYRLFLLSELRARERRQRPQTGVEACCAVLDAHRAQHGDTDRRTGCGRQGVRQQRVLGYLPHDLARVLAAGPAARGRAGRRLRAAVSRRRLGVALVVAGLREPDDRDQLGRLVRRRVRQGRARHGRPRHLRRGA